MLHSERGQASPSMYAKLGENGRMLGNGRLGGAEGLTIFQAEKKNGKGYYISRTPGRIPTLSKREGEGHMEGRKRLSKSPDKRLEQLSLLLSKDREGSFLLIRRICKRVEVMRPLRLRD